MKREEDKHEGMKDVLKKQKKKSLRWKIKSSRFKKR